MLLFKVSQLLSQIMNPFKGQLFAASHDLKLAITVPSAQQLDPPAVVDANTPILILFPSTPVKLAMGFAQVANPWKFLQLRQTSWKYQTVPGVLWKQLLQAWGWQQSMALSASCTMGTKQLQYPFDASAVGTPASWKITTSSGEITISLLVPSACLKEIIMFATVLGAARQFSMSKSTPSNPYLFTILQRALMKLLVLVEEAKTFGQLPFCPPIEINTFFPLCCQFQTFFVGKLASSTITLPSVCVFPKARITMSTLGLTSSVVDCPQKLPPNPQQNIEMFEANTVKVIANSMRRTVILIQLLLIQYLIYD